MAGVRLGPHHSRAERMAQQAMAANKSMTAPTLGDVATIDPIKQNELSPVPEALLGEEALSPLASVASATDHNLVVPAVEAGEDEGQDRVSAVASGTPLPLTVKVGSVLPDSPVTLAPLPITGKTFDEETAEETWRRISAKAARLAPTIFDAAKPTHDMFDRIIKIHVGIAEYIETFEIHMGLSIFYSDYFRAVLCSSDGVPQQTDITLINSYAHTFEAFRGWLYTRSLDHVAPDHLNQPVSPLLRLWTLADHLLVPLLKNQIIDTYFDVFAKGSAFPFGSLDYVYHNTSHGSALRLVLVDSLALTQHESTILSASINLGQNANNVSTSAFFFELCKALLDRQAEFKPYDAMSIRRMNKCKYHEHPEGLDCRGS